MSEYMRRILCVVLIFVKQKTAYEMLISDWSSDVCSSDLPGFASLTASQAPEAGVLIQRFVQYPGSRYTTAGEAWRQVRNHWLIPYGGGLLLIRSEERRVGQVCDSTCSLRRLPCY